jgi:D-sedoheptulose 7-phosphate isomerase
MQKDPRFLNQTFSTETIRAYLSGYSASLQKCLDSISQKDLDAASQMLRQVRSQGARIFVAGNGGSAAISEHLSCDWQKGVHIPGTGCLKVQCLTSNTSLLTAIANDFGYKETFAYQLELADLTSQDVVLLISSSGNSENVVKAADYAKSKGCKVIGLTGFSGGKLMAMADISLHIPFDNYGVVEDAHQALMHVLAQFHDSGNREGK